MSIKSDRRIKKLVHLFTNTMTYEKGAKPFGEEKLPRIDY